MLGLKGKKIKKNRAAFALAILLALGIIISGTAFTVKYIRNEQKKEYFVGSTLSLVINDKTDGRPFIGNRNAPITISIFVDVLDNNTGLCKTILQLKKDHFKKNKIKIVQHFYISEEDILKKSKRYNISGIIDAYYRKNNYTSAICSVLMGQAEKTAAFANKTEPKTEPNSIKIYKEDLYQDYTEIKKFGMVGVRPFFVIGIKGHDTEIITGAAPYKTINKTIKNYYTRIGIAY